MNDCKYCDYVGGPGRPVYDATFPCPGCGRGGPVMLYNPDPEQPDVRFYPVSTSYSDIESNGLLPSGTTTEEFYRSTLATWSPFGAPMPSDRYTSAVIEGTWYECLQPEYKAYPAIVAALSATKIEIGCEHIKMPFPAFAVRLPEGFMQDVNGPPLRCLLVAMVKNNEVYTSTPVASIDSDPAPGAMSIPFAVSFSDGTPDNALLIQAKYIDSDGDDAFTNFAIRLDRNKTLEEVFSDWVTRAEGEGAQARLRARAFGGYVVSNKMARELLSLAVGISFFATGRHKAAKPILQREKRPRHERRRFERDHDGEEQPTFFVGRELVLPREEGAPARDQGPGLGEGAGRSLRWGHYRTGHLRYQAHGPARSDRKLIFIEPSLVRPDLPLRPRVTPGQITGDRPSRDVTEDRL